MPARLLVILVGYAAAVLAASLVITVAIWLPSLSRDIARSDLGFPAIVLQVTLAAVAAFSIVPAVLALIYAERNRIRSVRAYFGLGGALGMLGLVVGLFFKAPPGSGLVLALALVAAGALGGLVYWAIAGRRAGGAR